MLERHGMEFMLGVLGTRANFRAHQKFDDSLPFNNRLELASRLDCECSGRGGPLSHAACAIIDNGDAYASLLSMVP